MSDSTDKLEKFFEAYEELAKAFEEARIADEKAQDEFWNSLSEEDRLNAFGYVTRKIHQGDIVEKGSYRYVLYDVFGFGPESYILGMDSGYMAIHNAIFDGEQFADQLRAFCKKYNIDVR